MIVPLRITPVSEATAVSPMITAAGSETMPEGSTVIKPSAKLMMHCKFP